MKKKKDLYSIWYVHYQSYDEIDLIGDLKPHVIVKDLTLGEAFDYLEYKLSNDSHYSIKPQE